MVALTDADMDSLPNKDGDNVVLKVVVAKVVIVSVLLISRVRVGDGARERVADDETLGKKEVLGVLLSVTLRVGSNSTVKLWNMLMESVDDLEDKILTELVGERDAEEESEYQTDDVTVVDDEYDELWLTVVDTVAELLTDSDVLSDQYNDTLTFGDNETDDDDVVV